MTRNVDYASHERPSSSSPPSPSTVHPPELRRRLPWAAALAETMQERRKRKTEPDNNDVDDGHDGRGHRKLKRSKKRSVGDEGIQQFEITQLSAKLLAKELKGLEAYDIPTLSKPYIPPLDTFFEEIVDLNQYGCDEVVGNGSKGYIEDDDEESDYEDSEKESGNSEEVSLDEESHSEEDFDVGVTNTEDIMLFGDPEDEEERAGQTIVNKMAKVYKTGSNHISLEDSSKYTIISDRHQAIVTGLHNVLPKASRRICVLHFYKNFASKFSAIALLQDAAYDWWKCVGENILEPVLWATFDELFRKEYMPEHFMEEKRDEFMKSSEGELKLPEYRQKFGDLAEFGRDLGPTMEKRCKRFMEGLRPDLSSRLISAPRYHINAMYKQALELHAALLRKAEYEHAQATLPRPPPPPRTGVSSKRPPFVLSSSHLGKKAKSDPAP
ncbi:unnamed protein product [Cuscuta campestris]|uniref:Retrotransposon gag domain-containing protein n=1 Tax=Cuscuta campestris TaxID=132261 RepID=A0A484KVL4_9ASTE|nr:unnamed protein product [Cuscuta campestris]